MALMDEILSWSETDLSLWKRDALRRILIREGTLTPEDYNELYRMLLANNHLGDGSEVEPQSLSSNHIPINPAMSDHVELVALRDIEHVNRLAASQTLPFEPNGITVIYGSNGSGKSGYARVLKKACRAREDRETIHTDLSDATAARAVPKAVFDLKVEGEDKELTWNSGQPSPHDLGTISVFDSSCARIYLKQNLDVAYLPYGLDLVKDLGDVVFPKLTGMVEHELATLNTDTDDFQHLVGETEVGKAVAGLSHRTDTDDLEKLATLTEDEEAHLSALTQTLSEDSPKERSDELKGSYQRLKSLTNEVTEQSKPFSNESLEKIGFAIKEFVTAESAVDAASKLLREDDGPLEGTGGSEWRALFDAAQKFALAMNYMEGDAIRTAPTDKCVLCQQPLGDDASERMKRFQEFVLNEASVTAGQKRQQYEEILEKLSNKSIQFDQTDSLLDELTRLDESLAGEVIEVESSLKAHKDQLVESVKNRSIEGIEAINSSQLRAHIRKLAADQLKGSRRYLKAYNPEQRSALEQEKAELEARQQFSPLVHTVIACVSQMKRGNFLDKCLNELKTRPISNKTKELSETHVNDELFSALKTEFERLQVREVQVVLETRVQRGTPQQTLSLDFSGSGRQERLEEVLSEGEQRAIALSSFFAELKLANHRGGICFDDPVSSLDHKRRHLVAKRLAEEASERQVIIFTHDATFLGQLRDQIKRFDVAHSIHHLEWAGRRPGHVKNGLPWDHQKYSERIDRLEKEQRRMQREWGDAQPSERHEQDIRSWYSKLRATVERVVQDVVLAGTVQRFSDYIRPKQLGHVLGFTGEENSRIQNLVQRCHDVVDAHDASSDSMPAAPTPQEFLGDIEELKGIIEVIRERRRS